MILVDTSVWIDHLHRTEPALVEMLERGDVATHPMVIEELALGRLVDRELVPGLLGQLSTMPALTHAELLVLVELQSLWGRGLSAVDAHLVGSLLLNPGASLWTRDKRLRAAAADVGIPTVLV